MRLFKSINRRVEITVLTNDEISKEIRTGLPITNYTKNVYLNPKMYIEVNRGEISWKLTSSSESLQNSYNNPYISA